MDILYISRNKNKHYYRSFDVLRVICIILLIFASFAPQYESVNYIRHFLNSVSGILFTLYGYIVLRDGSDLRKNIKHTAKVFRNMFVIYGILTIVYVWLTEGSPFNYLSKRTIFDFVVLNCWDISIGMTIWYVQSVLYALVIFWLLRRFRKYDWLFCILTFAFAAVTGEFAQIVHFRFFHLSCISGNFLTRTIPYMLLGRILNRKYNSDFRRRHTYLGEILLGFGIVASVVEYFLLYKYGYLIYENHMLGFIAIAVGACMIALKREFGVRIYLIDNLAKRLYKPIFFIFNPLAHILVLLVYYLYGLQEQYSLFIFFLALITAVLSVLLSYLITSDETKKMKKIINHYLKRIFGSKQK